jgi:hypothetical protein
MPRFWAAAEKLRRGRTPNSRPKKSLKFEVLTETAAAPATPAERANMAAF